MTTSAIPTPQAHTTTPAPALHPSALMTEEQAEMLGTLIQSMRPTWHARGIVKALEKEARTTDAITLTIALLHAAKNPTNQTPAIINHPGPHWDAARGITKPKPPTPSPTLGTDTSAMCERHPHLHAWECKACRRKSPKPPNFREMVEQATQQARQQHTHTDQGKNAS